MGIQRTNRKNRCFNILVIKTYYRLRNYIFLHTQSKEMTNRVLNSTFEMMYSLALNEVPFKELERQLYKIASERIKRGCKEMAL